MAAPGQAGLCWRGLRPYSPTVPPAPPPPRTPPHLLAGAHTLPPTAHPAPSPHLQHRRCLRALERQQGAVVVHSHRHVTALGLQGGQGREGEDTHTEWVAMALQRAATRPTAGLPWQCSSPPLGPQ